MVRVWCLHQMYWRTARCIASVFNSPRVSVFSTIKRFTVLTPILLPCIYCAGRPLKKAGDGLPKLEGICGYPQMWTRYRASIWCQLIGYAISDESTSKTVYQTVGTACCPLDIWPVGVSVYSAEVWYRLNVHRYTVNVIHVYRGLIVFTQQKPINIYTILFYTILRDDLKKKQFYYKIWSKLIFTKTHPFAHFLKILSQL